MVFWSTTVGPRLDTTDSIFLYTVMYTKGMLTRARQRTASEYLEDRRTSDGRSASQRQYDHYSSLAQSGIFSTIFYCTAILCKYANVLLLITANSTLHAYLSSDTAF